MSLFRYAGANAGTVPKPPTVVDPYAQFYARVPFAIQRPIEPTITREVTITTTGTTAGTDIMTEAQTSGTRIIVPNSVGNVGTIRLGGTSDIEIVAGQSALFNFLDLTQIQAGGSDSPISRFKIDGGRIKHVRTRDALAEDLIFDNCIFDSNFGGSTVQSIIFYFSPASAANGPNRVGVFNSMGKLSPDGAGSMAIVLADHLDDFMWANCNWSNSGNTGGGNWGWRVQGGNRNAILDNTVLISAHKMWRFDLNDFTDLLIEGGTWMREDGPSPDLPDAWKEVQPGGAIDGVIIRDLECWLAEPGTGIPANRVIRIGKNGDASNGTFVLQNIDFHAVNSDVVSATILQAQEDADGTGADYNNGTHTFSYSDPLTLPTDRWQNLPLLPHNGDPTQLADLP